MTARAALALVVLAFCAQGCRRNLLRVGGEEAVQVKDMRVKFEPGDRGDFDVRFRVRSPGLPAGALTGLDWELWLGNRWFASGTQTLTEPLPANGEREFTVRLPVVFQRTGAPPEDARTMDVGVRGAVTVQAGGAQQRLPFQARRAVDVVNAPVELED